MKRFLPLILAAIMIFAGCQNSSAGSAQNTAPSGERPQMSENGERPQRQNRPEGQNGERSQRRQNENGESAGEPQEQKQSKSADSQSERTGERQDTKQPSNEGGKTVTGTVKSIVGNEVTLITDENNTEATETYLLPVGMKIGQKDFSSVKEGNTLKITFGTHPDDKSEIITSVEIASGGR